MTDSLNDWVSTLLGSADVVGTRGPGVGGATGLGPAPGLDDESRLWHQSGAAALTGRPDGPILPPPDRFVARVGHLGRLASVGSTEDALALLGERAAHTGHTRHGRQSCGGATRLIDAADAVVAVALARPTDIEAIPALLEIGEAPVAECDRWTLLTELMATRPAAHWVERGCLLGLAIATLGEEAVPRPSSPAVQVVDHGDAGSHGCSPEGLTVVDLSSLWAGPLCARILQRAGADVVKVEGANRPDGARRGSPSFFDALHRGQSSVTVDLTSGSGREELAELLRTADIVIEGSRPRALRGLGIDPTMLLRDATPRVWIAITGYGQTGPGAERVAFGDDAAVAGGLIAQDVAGPVFLADAIADPLTGMAAAAAALAALRSGRKWYVDIAMARVAAAFAAPACG